MKRSIVVSVFMAGSVVATIIATAEFGYVYWQVALGFAGTLVIGVTAVLARNGFVIFMAACVALLSAYLGLRFELYGLAPGVITGSVIVGCLKYGWFTPYQQHYGSLSRMLAEMFDATDKRNGSTQR